MDAEPITLVPAPPAPTDAATALQQFADALTTIGWQVYHRYTDRTLVGFCSLNGAGHYKYLFEAALISHSNDTVFDAWRYRPDGTLDAHATIPYPTEAGAEYKAESGVLWMAIEGSDLVIYDGFHLAVTTDGRPVVTAIYALVGFVVDPYPQGTVPMGASFELARLPGAPGPAPDPTPTPGLSNAEVTADALAALQQAMGAPDPQHIYAQVQHAAENAVLDALANHLPAAFLTVANMGQAYANSPQVQQQLDNRIGLQLWKFGLLSGLVPDAKLPAWVKNPATGYPWPDG